MPYTAEAHEALPPGYDASNDMSTELCFNPPEGPFDDRNVVTGEIGHVGDEDWIAIKLTAGNQYTITVTGTKADGTDLDTVLKLMDEKGGEIMMNDDYKGKDGNLMLGSQIVFPPEAGTGTQTYFLSVSGYTGNPVVKNIGTYSVSVKEVATLAVGTGPAIAGTSGIDKINGTDLSEAINGDDGSDTIHGNGGNDTIDGGTGDDFIAGGKGADMITGGGGEDTISYAYSSAGVRINLRAGSASGGDAEGDKLVDAIENVHGSMHDDVLSGSRGVGNKANNKIWGLGGNDELFGDRGDDRLYGGAGDDVLDGGEGNDKLEGGYGADELIGGGGADDEASYMHSMMGVTVRLHAMQAMGGDAEGDTFGKTTTASYTVTDEDDGGVIEEVTETVPDIMNLRGSAHDDILAGDSRGNKIWGGGGNDTLYGGPSGNDDSGNADELHGEGGHDRIFGGRGDDTLYGGAGNDHLWGNGGVDTFYGGAGDDMYYADADDAFNIDTDDDDTDPQPDEGNDTISFELLKAAVIGGEGGTYTLAANIENLIGTSENDNLTGNNLSNTIEGGDGADMLRGGANDEGHTDTLSYESSDRRVRVNLDDGSASGGHAQGDDIGSNGDFMHLIGSAYDDVLTGSRENNTLKGLAGDDEIIGGADNDTVEGGAGADEMNGGSPQGSGGTNDDGEMDTLSYASSDAGVMVNLAALTASGGHAEGDEIVGERDAHDPDGPEGDKDPVDVATFENVTGSDHDDRLTGDHRMNVLMGGKGNDTLKGLAGADTLHGGPGADMLDGGEDPQEKDNMVPDSNDGTDPAPMDIASYAMAKAGVTVNMDTMKGTAGDAEGDTLVNIEKVVGSAHDDMFIAGSKADNIDGGGNPMMMPKGDTVSYELSEDGVRVDLGDRDSVVADADLMNGRDSYALGDTLDDIENLTGSNHKDILIGDSGANNTLIGGGGDDQLFGIGGTNHLHGNAGNDTLTGGNGADTLMGGDGRDTLNGVDGTNTLNGGAGDDEMTAGNGDDTFVFSPEDGDGDDIINGFAVTADRIDLSAFELEAEDLADLISVRGGAVRIDLRSVGGGTIELNGVTSVDDLDSATGSTSPVDVVGTIQMLSVWMDDNGNGTMDATDGNGMVDTGEAGIFIL